MLLVLVLCVLLGMWQKLFHMRLATTLAFHTTVSLGGMPTTLGKETGEVVLGFGVSRL